MIDLALDNTLWDLTIVNGDLALVEASDCAAQHVAQRLKLFSGEWFLDLDAGVPWFQDILIKNPNPDLVSGILTETILDSPDIVELTQFDLDLDSASRTLTVNFSARASDGETVTVSTSVGV